MTIQRFKEAFSLFRRGYGGYKKQIIILAALGFLSGLLEGVGVNAIIPLFSFVSNSDNHGTDLISRSIQILFSLMGVPYSLKYLLIFICILFIIKALTVIWFGYINIKITSDYEKRTRDQLFKETLRSKWPYLLRQKIGYLEQVLLTDVNRGATLLRHLSGAILLVTNLAIYLAIAFNISLLITSLTLLLGLVVFIFFKPIFFKARMISTEQASVTKKVANLINENMVGIKTVKAANKESAVMERAEGFFEKLRETSIRGTLISVTAQSLIEPLGIFFIIAMFVMSYKLPTFNFASFAVIIYLIQKIFSYIQIAQNRWQIISEMQPYLLSTIKYRDDAAKNPEIDEGRKNFIFKKSLKFQNVSFSYGSDKCVLSDIAFSVDKGGMVGLIGPSGAGKTTIVDLILRLFHPQKGQIYLDDMPVSEIELGQWRKKISYVSQDIFLLNDTIANNIRFYNSDLTDAEIISASKIANIFDFIQSLPQGFETSVGERGMMLSGGQRQRIILARALVTKPEILILDEATSSLDNESEIMFQKAIEGLKRKVTVIAIAHRLSTIMNSDRLLVLEDGRITSQDAPQKLLKDKNSYFYKVYNIREKTAGQNSARKAS